MITKKPTPIEAFRGTNFLRPFDYSPTSHNPGISNKLAINSSYQASGKGFLTGQIVGMAKPNLSFKKSVYDV